MSAPQIDKLAVPVVNVDGLRAVVADEDPPVFDLLDHVRVAPGLGLEALGPVVDDFVGVGALAVNDGFRARLIVGVQDPRCDAGGDDGGNAGAGLHDFAT